MSKKLSFAFPPDALLWLAAVIFFAAVVSTRADSTGEGLQKMLDAKVADFREKTPSPDGVGALVFAVSPSGEWCVTSSLPEGAGADSHYRIASVSKTFTAAAVMLLDQQGKLRIDDFLTDNIPGKQIPYLADSPRFAIPGKESIRIRDLLSHRARIFDVFNTPLPQKPYNGLPYAEYVKQVLKEPDHQFTQDELIGVLAANNLRVKEKDTVNGFKYSDTGYTILAKIIERVSGESYDRFLAEQFFGPMDLKNTSAPWSAYDTGLPEPCLRGVARLAPDDDFEDVTDCNMSDQVGPGNIISTPRDIARWMRGLLSGRGPLARKQVERMIAVPDGNTTYALGIGSTEAGRGHSGAHPGFVNLVTYDEKDDTAVAVVTPFIDYSRLREQLDFLNDVTRSTREILHREASR